MTTTKKKVAAGVRPRPAVAPPEAGVEGDAEVAGGPQVEPAKVGYQPVAAQGANKNWSSAVGAAKGGKVEGKGPPPPVVALIRGMAITRAAEPKTVSLVSNTYQRLSGYYLKELLDSPAPLGSEARKKLSQAAIEKIGAQLEKPSGTGDYWEDSAAEWGHQKLPAGLNKLISGFPKDLKELGAATDILSLANRPALGYLDVPQLVGKANEEVGVDADVTGGGKNISQLMHWATGVKYASKISPSAMRDLFLAYETWHLEAWDVFGEDPINDMIAEQQGAIFGRMLGKGEVNKDNLRSKLDDSFAESRAWLGAMLKKRQPQLDAWLNTPEDAQPKANMWWGKLGQDDVWQGQTLNGMLKSGMSVDDVRKSSFATRAADIYSLIYESDAWQKQHGDIPLSAFSNSLLAGKYDDMMKKLIDDEPLSKKEMGKAWHNAHPHNPLGLFVPQ